MPPLCKIEVTHPWVLGSREVRRGVSRANTGWPLKPRILREPPDLLLTTPESLEAVLISPRVDHRGLLSDVRSVIVDELHAFAGDDRGWHLLALLERIERLAGRRLQRLGLSATIGNAEELKRCELQVSSLVVKDRINFLV